MKSKYLRWAVALIAALLVAVGGFQLYQLQRERGFAEIIHAPPDQIVKIQVLEEGESTVREIDLTDERREQMVDALEEMTFKWKRSSSSMQNCYARMTLETADGGRIELLLTTHELLVNALDTEGRSPVYGFISGGEELEEFMMEEILG